LYGKNPASLSRRQATSLTCVKHRVSSGRTDRHRLHRGGDRDANSALRRIALVRMHCH
jgi:transposase